MYTNRGGNPQLIDAVQLPGRGARAYLDIDAVVRAGVEAGCAFVHPGYGFLSENSAFCDAVTAAGMVFVGPTADALALYGDKLKARALAVDLGVPVLPGTGAVDAAGRLRFSPRCRMVRRWC